MRRHVAARWAVAWLGIACGCFAAAAEPRRQDPLTTAQLLVDVARDYGLQQAGRQTPADVAYVKAWLRAAVRLDPNLTDAHMWLYELAELEGDAAAAAAALRGLIQADPQHETAFARWLAAGVHAQQTAEQQRTWLEAVAAGQRSPAQLAIINVALAGWALERMDRPEARRYLGVALANEPTDVDAARLGLDLLEPNSPPDARLRATLRVLQATPASVHAAWQAAALLDEYGFATEAARFFEHALAVHSVLDQQTSPPAGFLLDLARNLLARGDIDAAIARTREAVVADPLSAAQAGMFLYYLLERQQPGSGKAVRDQLAERFAQLREPGDYPVNEVAQAAWFYITVEAQPERALMLARNAAGRAAEDPFVKRVLGWALALDGKSDEARAALEPLARRDAFAAAKLAELLRASGDTAGASRVLDSLDVRPTAGPALDIWQQAAGRPQSQPSSVPSGVVPHAADATPPSATNQPTTQAAVSPAARRYPDIARALADFDERVLAFPGNPARFLEAAVEPEDSRFLPGDPWWIGFRLTNRGPFPITLGPDGMVNPVLVLSFHVEGDRQRELPYSQTVSVDRVRVLHPGKSVQVRRTLDVGPLRRVSQDYPQQLQRVTVRAILAAVCGPDGEWRPGVGGQVLPPVYFNRVPASTNRDAMDGLLAAMGAADPAACRRAIDVAAELVGEQQRAELKRLEYRPSPVPTDRLVAGLLGALGSDNWEVRVRTLEAMQVMGLDQRSLEAAGGCLEHSHWLVRMMALRLLARQGATFTDRVRQISESDADELVQALARSLLQKWAEQPADTQPSPQR